MIAIITAMDVELENILARLEHAQQVHRPGLFGYTGTLHGQQVIAAVCGMAPARVVYVSCNVATQARDLKRFAELGYTAAAATAVDLFPRTAHVETVVLLSRA